MRYSILLRLLMPCLILAGCSAPAPAAYTPSIPLPTVQPATAAPIPASPTAVPFTPSPTLVPTLRQLADARGLCLGVATHPSYLEDPEYAALVTREFNCLIPEVAMKWEVLHPEPERYDFSAGDAIVAFAQAHDMRVVGHVLVWDSQLPEWVLQGTFTRAEWKEILHQHITTVVEHYRGQVFAWHVVNEALNDEGLLRDTIWSRNIGPEYIALAFQWAHEADPDALLIYNDNAADGLNPKSEALYGMLQGLLRLGVPVDGVGLQMHVWLDGPPTAAELAANMQRLADLELVVQISEMDVRTQYSQASLQEKLAAQAEMYRLALSTCLQAANCDTFMTWGLTDRYSWIPGYTGKDDAPLLFDREGKPKPAYDAVREVLQQPR